MKKLSWLILFVSAIFYSCGKENSLESGLDNNSLIIGTGCSISKIVYSDTAIDVALGSIAAVLEDSGKVASITVFDSLGFILSFLAEPAKISDTVFINNNEYYQLDQVTLRVKGFHGLFVPTNPFSPQFDIAFTYNPDGNLVKKSYSFSATPATPYQEVIYTYSAGNLVQMTTTDLTTGNKISDAEMSFYPLLTPRNYLYLFPDEYDYAEYSQFYNFGKRSVNAVKSMKVRFYAPGNIPIDSAVSSFRDYVTSVDNYALSVIMEGDDQPSVPARASRLNFSYSCP